MNAPLRVIVDGPGPAAWNMAVDEALATSPGPAVSLTLRCYSWQSPTLSLGHHQDASVVDVAALRDRGAELVRRPTGGMAVYHDEEVTVALAAREGSGWEGGLSDLVALLSAGLAEGLRCWGLAASSHSPRTAPRPEEGRGSAACFCGGGRSEVWVGRQKIAGLAARRWGRRFLVHGSLLMGRAHLGLADVLRAPPEERERLRAMLEERTACLADLLVEPPGLAEVVGETVRAVARLAGQELCRGELSLEERALAWELARETYSSPLGPAEARVGR